MGYIRIYLNNTPSRLRVLWLTNLYGNLATMVTIQYSILERIIILDHDPRSFVQKTVGSHINLAFAKHRM